MSGLTRCLTLAAGFVWLAAPAAAGEPAAGAAPFPQIIVTEIGPPPPHVFPHGPVPQLRENRYAVWDFYAVDRYGHFRPRVVATPGGGGYYLSNGQPYPWAAVRPLDRMPYIVD